MPQDQTERPSPPPRPASPKEILELMAERIESVGLYGGTDTHHDRGVASPPTVIGAFEWARGQVRPDWRTRENKALWAKFHVACFEALHQLAVYVTRDRLVAPRWWVAGQQAWEAHAVCVWGEFHTGAEVVAAIRAAASGDSA